MRPNRVILAGVAVGVLSAGGGVAVSGAASSSPNQSTAATVPTPAPSAEFWQNYNESMAKAAKAAPRPKLTKRERSKLVPSATKHRGRASSAESRKLVRSIAPQLVSTDAVVPAPEDVEKILSPTALKMKGKGGRDGGVMVSNLPMATAKRDGGKTPQFDLSNISWESADGAFKLKSPVVPVSIAKTAGGEVSIGNDISLRLTDKNRTATGVISGETATYPSIATDTDMVVRSLPTGVQVGWLLRSPQAEHDLRVPIDLKAGQKLVSSQVGSVQILNKDGYAAGEVSIASAVDADHHSVPMKTAVEGNTIVYRVDHAAGDVKYPIVVDPQVADVHWDAGTYNDPNDGWFFQKTPNPNTEPYLNGRNQQSSAGRGQLAILGQQAAGYSQTSAGAWGRFAPGDPTYGSQQSGTTRRVSPEHGYWWRFDAGSLAYSVYPNKTEHYYNYPASVVEMLSRDGVADTRTQWAFLDGSGNPGAANSGLMFNKLANGTNGTSAAVWLGSNPYDSARTGNGANSSDNTIAFGLNAIAPYYYWNYEHPLSAMGMGWYRAWASDTTAPAIDTSSPGSGNWQTTPPATIPVTASDRGMGVGAIRLERTADSGYLAGPSSPPTCPSYSYTVCQFTWSGSVSGTAIPEGRSTARLRATDGDGLQTVKQLTYAIDSSAPDLTLSGDLYTQRAIPIPAGQNRPLTITAADGVPGGTPQQQRSGVQRVEVFVDDESVFAQDQTQTGDSRGLTATWTPPADTFTSGDYRVEVVVTDRLGQSTTTSFTVKAPCCGTPLPDGTSPVGSRIYDFGDADGDGVTDAILVDQANGNIAVRKGTGNGSFGAETAWASFGTAIDKITVGDATPIGTENTDDLVARAADGSLLFRPSNGTTYIAADTTDLSDLQTQWPTGRTLQLQDLDGDGQADLVGVDTTTREVRVGYSVGGGFDATTSWATVPANARGIIGDLDGDGLSDLVIYTPSDGSVQIRRSTGSGFSDAEAWDTGPTNSDVVLGDLDANGLTDMVFRDGSDTVTGRISSRDGGFAGNAVPLGSLAQSFALNADDLTGDGRSDVLGARVASGNLETRAAASTVRDSEAPDSSPTDPDSPDEDTSGSSAARAGTSAAAAPAKAEIAMSDDAGLKYGQDLGGNTAANLLTQMKYLGATKIRTVEYWGNIDRLSPDDEPTLTPVDPTAVPAASQSATGKPPANVRTVRLARDPADPAAIGDDVAVDDPQPEWIDNPRNATTQQLRNPNLREGGEWVIVRDRLFVKRLNSTYGAIQAATGLNVHVTISGGTASFTKCDGAEASLRITPTDVRGCRPNDGTGDRPDPQRAGHAIASIAEYLRTKFGSMIYSIGVWNEPNLSSATFFSRTGTKKIKDSKGNTRFGQLDRSSQYGAIYGWTWKEMNDRKLLGKTSDKRIRIAFGELSSAITGNDGQNAAGLRNMQPDTWTDRALAAAQSAHNDWPDGVVRADIFAVHPYQHYQQKRDPKALSARPWQVNSRYPWGVRGLSASVRKVKKNGQPGDVLVRSLKAYLTRAATSGTKTLRRIDAKLETPPFTWATEFGYFNTKGNSALGYKNDALIQAHTESERTRFLTYNNTKTKTLGALPGMSQLGQAKVIAFWESLEDPQASILAKAGTTDDYGFIGSGKTIAGNAQTGYPASTGPDDPGGYSNQLFRVQGPRPYGPPGRDAKNPTAPENQTLQRSQNRTVACAIRGFAGSNGPPVSTDPLTRCP